MIPISTPKFVLLAEDNQDDEILTLHAFTENKIANEIIVVRDGSEALDFFFRDTARPLPFLTLLDLNLPKVSGLEVLRRLRSTERTKLLPVVVLTTSAEEQDIVQSYSLGCNSYIRKPVDMKQFVSIIGQLGLYWLILNESPPRSGKQLV